MVDVTVSPDDKIVVEIDHAEGVWIDDCVELSRFYLTWRSFRMSAPSCSRSARMRLSLSRSNSMRRNLSLIRERTPECFLPQYQRRFTRISQDFAIILRSELPQKKSFRWEATRRSRRQDTSMTSRSQITMRSFRPVRA